MNIKESDYIRSFVVITLKSLKTPIILKPYNQAHMSGSNDLVRTYYYDNYVILRVSLSRYELDIPELKVIFRSDKTFDIKINYKDLISISIEHHDVGSRYIQECQRYYYELSLQTSNQVSKSCLGDLDALAKLKEQLLNKK